MSRMMGFMRGLPGASAYEIAVSNGFVGTEAEWLASIGGGGGSGGPVGWDSVTGKPATFPPAAHGHAIGDVAGLQPALDGKAATGHTHAWAGITDVPATFPPAPHVHAIAGVTGLQAELDGKAAAAHVHSIANITGLQAALDALAARQNNWIGTQAEYDALPQATRDDTTITFMVV